MNKLTIVRLIMLMTVFVSQIAMANTSMSTDLDYAFGASPDTLQIDLLDTKEMEATQGDWWYANISYDGKSHF
jgi:hypothetical protein